MYTYLIDYACQLALEKKASKYVVNSFY